ncbi:hypothetical protein [Halorubrum laminariae]|uniref:Uncharacterized protein n=1 Tax=Halorubrum laminariae TaxID=1433523 RepID=A0ABD6C334_9EURY|nr:hypothetical protein [Halorubrum laminariae]
MTALTEYGFKPADVEFLLTVQNLENNPTDYDNTDPGKAPANVSAIREETSLTKSQVAYRAREGENGRGFAEDDMGLLRVHPPTVQSGAFGPRSVELTDKGRKVISEIRAERSGSAGGDSGATSAEINELEQQISELQNDLENISESLETIQRSRMGAIDSEMADRLTASLRLFPRHQFILSEILGLDMEELAEAGDLDTVDKDELRREVLETLAGEGELESGELDDDDLNSVLED